MFSWLDGTMVIGYILATGLVYGTVLLALMAGATRMLGRFEAKRLHHIAQALIPIAGAGVFLGLSATTLSLLRAEHVPLFLGVGCAHRDSGDLERMEPVARVARHASL